jgi:hypothetical protein
VPPIHKLPGFRVTVYKAWKQFEVRHNGYVKEAPRQTITHRSDEPQLNLGDRVATKDGVVGVVLARYKSSGGTDQIHYIVELRPEETERGKECSLSAPDPNKAA